MLCAGHARRNSATRPRGCAIAPTGSIVSAPQPEDNIMRRIAMVVALLLAGAAHGQTLYKCVSRDLTSYQQTPCPRSARTVRSIHTVPEPPPTSAERVQQRQKAQDDRAESAFLSHLAGTDQWGSRRTSVNRSAGRRTRHDRFKDACDTATKHRERTLHKVGLDRGLDLSRRLDDEVAEACRRH
jgi:hypothetical protein